MKQEDVDKVEGLLTNSEDPFWKKKIMARDNHCGLTRAELFSCMVDELNFLGYDLILVNKNVRPRKRSSV